MKAIVFFLYWSLRICTQNSSRIVNEMTALYPLKVCRVYYYNMFSIKHRRVLEMPNVSAIASCYSTRSTPMIFYAGEHKTKPTQVSVREIRGLGISPDIIVCRSEKPIDESCKAKVSSFCHVSPNQASITNTNSCNHWHWPITSCES